MHYSKMVLRLLPAIISLFLFILYILFFKCIIVKPCQLLNFEYNFYYHSMLEMWCCKLKGLFVFKAYSLCCFVQKSITYFHFAKEEYMQWQNTRFAIKNKILRLPIKDFLSARCVLMPLPFDLSFAVSHLTAHAFEYHIITSSY